MSKQSKSKQTKKSSKKLDTKPARERYEEWRNNPRTPIGGPEWEDLPDHDPMKKIMLEEEAKPGSAAERREASVHQDEE